MKSWAFGAMVVSMFAVAAGCGSKGTTGTTTGDTGGSGGTGSNTTGSNTTGSNTTGSNTTGSNTTGSNTTGSNTTGATSSTGSGTGCMATGQDFQIPECNDCLATNCCAEQTACDTGTECDTTFSCLAACASGDMACQMACGTASQQGATDHDALITCLQDSCSMECTQGGKICDSGLVTPSKPACGDCLGLSCCAEFTACTADAACKACILAPSGAGCDMNALLKSANDCANSKCSMECM